MKVGEKAPDFTLKASNNSEVSLKDYRGKNVVLYFYPRDNTPGWINEANEFGKLYNNFKKIDTEIIGVSPDSVDSHQSFVRDLTIPFILLSDKDKEVAQKYEVYKDEGILSKIGLGLERSTFVIDKEGILRQEYRKVGVKGHAEEVFEFVKENL